MLTREQNDLLTRTGPGTPGGDLMRRYWQPAALSEELPPGSPPQPVRLLGEDLVLFRDEAGRPGLLGLHCPHRGADLSYGRLEDGGLRCLYHGWLFDVTGQCREQPGEPAGSTFRQRVRHTAYPCLEAAGIIFAYLGPGEPPLLPAYEALTVPDAHRFVIKYFHECNYLQGEEGEIDPVHTSYLHRQFVSGSGETDYREIPREGHMPLYGRDVAPRIEIDETDYGVRIFSIRNAGADTAYLRITNFVMPNLSAIAGQTGEHGYAIHWHVPIDDVTHWKYDIIFCRTAPLDLERMRRAYAAQMAPGYRFRRTLANRYQQDRAEMAATSFSGMGAFFPAHDAYATETQGPIQDRTQERLGSTDKAIARARQMLLRAIRDVQAGREPPHVVRDPAANDFSHLVVLSKIIPADADWRTAWRAAPAAAEPLAAGR
ncbi:MAG TPA: Rieske 2Fe-2S domain-containing protein [Chloroflexota bacterium]|nr:Rieske 2Fe-2S domain-containing protein [Chloroflexota bacterium]